MPNIYVPINVSKNVATSEAASNLTFNKFVTDLSKAASGFQVLGIPATLVAPQIGDQIQIGVIPAGEILVPHLCRFTNPIIDSGATGIASLGTTALPAGIKATASVQAAATYVGSGFAISTGEVGADNAETPVYLTFTAAVATLAATGLIVWDQVTRPWNSMTDGPSTS